MRPEGLSDLGIAARLARDLNVYRLGQHFTNATAHHGVVVTEDHTDHGVTS